MSKPVFITSDSTCDLTPELLERFQQAGSCALDNDRILLQPVGFCH